MHKRTAIADLEFDDATGSIRIIKSVHAPEHFPVGTSPENGIVDRAALNAWWTGRSIPASFTGVRKALDVLDVSSTKLFLLWCYGLALSDHYWIRPNNPGLTWD